MNMQTLTSPIEMVQRTLANRIGEALEVALNGEAFDEAIEVLVKGTDTEYRHYRTFVTQNDPHVGLERFQAGDEGRTDMLITIGFGLNDLGTLDEINECTEENSVAHVYSKTYMPILWTKIIQLDAPGQESDIFFGSKEFHTFSRNIAHTFSDVFDYENIFSKENETIMSIALNALKQQGTSGGVIPDTMVTNITVEIGTWGDVVSSGYHICKNPKRLGKVDTFF